MLDREAFAAQQQRGLHPVAGGEAAQHIAQTGHSWCSVAEGKNVSAT
jgi:hypothetical protein